MKSMNILLVGVGGQGVILASDILAETALEAGYDVKKTDVLGMAQRGGSVTSQIRIGPEVYSPLIKSGDAEVMLAFEKLEAARLAPTIKPEAVAIVNDDAVYPQLVASGGDEYPTDDTIIGAMRRSPRKLHMIDAVAVAKELGNLRVVNVIMLGFLSRFLEIDEKYWIGVLTRLVPSKALELNKKAFARGQAEADAKLKA
jgi:indolepyruvate ferredoxin oxidoreductase, beta subunit